MLKSSPLMNVWFLVAKWTAKGAALGVWCHLLGFNKVAKFSRELLMVTSLGDGRGNIAVGGAVLFGWLGLLVALFMIAAGCKHWNHKVQATFRIPWDVLTIAFDWVVLLFLLPIVAWIGIGPVLFCISIALAAISVCTFVGLSLSGPMEALKDASQNSHPWNFLTLALIEIALSIVGIVFLLLLSSRSLNIDIVSWIVWPIGMFMFVAAIALSGGLAESISLQTTILGVFLLPLRGFFSITRKVVVVTTQTVNPFVAIIAFGFAMLIAVSIILSATKFIITAASPINSIVTIAVPIMLAAYATDACARAMGTQSTLPTEWHTESSQTPTTESGQGRTGKIASAVAVILAIGAFAPMALATLRFVALGQLIPFHHSAKPTDSKGPHPSPVTLPSPTSGSSLVPRLAGSSRGALGLPPISLQPSTQEQVTRATKINSAALKRHNAGDYRAAVDGFREAVKVNPGNITARYNLACAYSRVGDGDSALAILHDLKTNGCTTCLTRIGNALTEVDFQPLRDRAEFVAIVGTASTDPVSEEIARKFADALRTGKVGSIAMFLDSHPIRIRGKSGVCDTDECSPTVTELKGADALSRWLTANVKARKEREASGFGGLLIPPNLACQGECCVFSGGEGGSDGTDQLNKVCVRKTNGTMKLSAVELTEG